ncbi:hypothetical protein Goarm_010854 [Gossypium armourianum]|uniref:Uncharacterized protein n=1 Tax=Gossypium armourianum TaxID=34283 RepID=A0A7J9IXN6_9ROSI|nr:hypothetical protein [Gossypium armourianum]
MTIYLRCVLSKLLHVSKLSIWE